MTYSKEDGRYRPTKTATVPKATVSSNVTNSNEGRYRPATTSIMPKVTVATSTMPKITVSSNSVNTDEGRYRPTATPAMPKVTISYNAADSSAESPSFLERAKDTIFGAWGKSLASDINAAANLYDLGQGGRDTMIREHLSAYEDALKDAQRDLAQLCEDDARPRDIADQQAIVDDFQRKYDAMSAAQDEQCRTTEAAYGLADDVKTSAEARIDHAKDGANALGRFAVDVGVNKVQTSLDAVKSKLLLGGPSVLTYAGRKYGEHTQDARQDGADAAHAALYGATAAGVDAVIEKAFDGLNGIYGKAATAGMAEKFKKLASKPQMQKLIGATFNDVGESLESFATDLADQLLKASYNDKSIGQNISETEWGRVGRNMLINAIVGIISGDTAFRSIK